MVLSYPSRLPAVCLKRAIAHEHHRPGIRGAEIGDLNLVQSGTTTNPFDMVVRNDLDRYRLVMNVIDREVTDWTWIN